VAKRQGIAVDNRTCVLEVPDECPICHRHSAMGCVVASFVENPHGIQAVFRCGFQGCRAFFICFYWEPSLNLIWMRPLKPPESIFPETISKLSPSFVSIFSEAAEAKHLGLKQVAGPGYRKAFEFLMKDYAKSLAPESKHKEIEAEYSGKVVADFISDPRIQGVAKRCLWLGNDETHYLRRWTDRDVEDLVVLIKLATNWIEIDRLSKKCIEEMPEGSAK
jgi:hypothetical protein